MYKDVFLFGSPRQPQYADSTGASTRRAVYITQICALLLVLLTSHAFGQQDVSKRRGDAHSQFVAKQLDPKMSKIFKVLSDDTGRYIQIDDMRFRVDDLRPFGYKGRMWHSGRLVYEFAPEVKRDHRTLFVQTCKSFTGHAGISCFERNKDPIYGDKDYVYVYDDPKENHSMVGMVGGKQKIGIHHWTSRAITHEIMHALGWEHEHSRSDRDQYVRVIWENIERGKEHNFEVSRHAETWSTYDFESIMHYHSTAFSIDWQAGKKTIEPLPEYRHMESIIGRSETPSRTDLKELAARYREPGQEWCGYVPGPPPSGCGSWDCSGVGWCCLDTGQCP